jgi:hypothetical protein
MLVAALLAVQSPLPIEKIDSMLKSRDFLGLSSLLDPLPKGARNPFDVIKAGGAYQVGRFGWNATELPSVNNGPPCVVIGTQLTSEDIGQLVFERDGNKLKFIPESETLGVEVERHKFIVKFHPDQKKVDLFDRIDFRAPKPGRRFLFRMSPQYLVTSISDGNGEPVTFTQSQGVVMVRRLSIPEFDYKVQYSATVDLPGYAGSIGPNEATLTNDYWYPMIARGPAPYDVEVHAPLGWISVGQGEKVSTYDTAHESISKFRMDLPVTYYSLSAAPYKVVTNMIGGRRFSTWSLRMKEDAMEAQNEFYASVIKFYERFAKFPFSGYGAVDSAVYGGGALEAYSFATWGGGLPAEDAHEPAHTWFGGILDNTYLHSFWNESFAVFCDGMYHRNVPIGSVPERRLAFVQSGEGSPDYNGVAILDGGVDAGSVSGSLGYGKGSQVLQMLEQFLGTEKMTTVMRDWISHHEKGTPAEWPEFVQVAEKDAPGLKLQSFFDDWLARPGYAKLDADVKYGNGKTLIKLKWKGPRFRMPLLVMTRASTGADSFHLFDTASGDVFAISGAKPAVVSIDPFRQALRDIGSDETPVQLNGVSTSKKYVDSHQTWASATAGQVADPLIAPDLDGATVVGSPETLPWMKPLCDKVGFVVHGDRLTYKGTTIDLNHGSATAVVSLGGEKVCKIFLGKTRVRGDYGRARLALTDELGRFLRGETEPKTRGKLTYRL